MMMMPPPPPAIPYPTKPPISKLFKRSLRDTLASDTSTDKKSSLYASYSKLSSHSAFSGKGSPTAYSDTFSSPVSSGYNALGFDDFSEESYDSCDNYKSKPTDLKYSLRPGPPSKVGTC